MRFNSCVCVFFIPMGSRVKPCPNMGICDVNKSHGLNARFWLVERKFAALWLVRTQGSPYYYSLWAGLWREITRDRKSLSKYAILVANSKCFFFVIIIIIFRCSTCSDVWQVVISHCVFSLHFGFRSGLCVLSGTFCVRSYIVCSYSRCKNMRRKSQALTGTLIQSWRGLVLLCKSNLRKTSRINKVSRNATQIILN